MTVIALAPTTLPSYDVCLQLIWALLADEQVAAATTVYTAIAMEAAPRPVLAIELHTAGGLLAIAQGEHEVAAARWNHACRLAADLLDTSDDMRDRATATRLASDCQRFLMGDI